MMLEFLAEMLQNLNIQNTNPYFLVAFPTAQATFNDLTPEQRTPFMTTWINIWFPYVQSYRRRLC